MGTEPLLVEALVFAVVDNSRDSENMIIAGMRLTEACLLAAKPSSCLGKAVHAIAQHSLHCLDNTGCEADRSKGYDFRRLASFLQWEGGGFLPDSRNDTFLPLGWHTLDI